MTGRPDFQELAQWQSAPVVSESSVTYPAGDYTIWEGPSAAWGSVQLRFVPSAGFGQITFEWWDSASKSVLLDIDFWYVSASTGVTAITPAKGPYLEIVATGEGSASFTTTAYVLPRQQPESVVRYTGLAQFYGVTDQSLAAGAKSDYYFPQLARGLAFIVFHQYDTAGNLVLFVNALAQDGSIAGDVCEIVTTTQTVQQLFTVPDMPLLLRVQNNGTVASSYTVGMTIPGG